MFSLMTESTVDPEDDIVISLMPQLNVDHREDIVIVGNRRAS